MSEQRPIKGLQQVDSTNVALRDWLQSGAVSQAVLWAQEQTAGRGRLGRSWLSPAGGLYYSVSTPVGQCPPPLFGFAAGLAAYESLQETLTTAPSTPKRQISLKWPNDLLGHPDGDQRECKLGGMLSEYVTDGVTEPHVIVGLGINVNTDVSLDDIQGPQPGNALPPISLRALTGREHDLNDLVTTLTARVFAQFEALLQTEPRTLQEAQETLRTRWSQACSTLQRSVRIDAPGKSHTGVVEDIDPSFALRLRDESGEYHTIQAGDCIHLRG